MCVEGSGARRLVLSEPLFDALGDILQEELERRARELLEALRERFLVPATAWQEPAISEGVQEVVALVKAPVGALSRLIVAEEPEPEEESEPEQEPEKEAA